VHDPFTAKAEALVPKADFEASDVVADSGATRHMFHDRKHFTNYRVVHGHYIKVADGKVVPAEGIGDVGPLRDVLHVPSLVYDLMSESELDRAGKWLVCGGGKRVYYEQSAGGNIDYAKVFLTAKLNDKGLYVVNPMYLGLANRQYNYKCYDALATKTEAIDLLHRTLGHVSIQRLEDWVRNGVIEWKHESEPVRFKKYASPCVACSLAKSKRTPHTKHNGVPWTSAKRSTTT